MTHIYQGDDDLCLKLADDFYKVAQSVTPDPFEILDHSAYPYAINMSFACELYLKALAIKFSQNNEFEGTHDLWDLYHKLPVTVQLDIRNNYEDDDYRDRLEQFLDEDRKVFVEWRYPFANGQRIGDLYFSDFQLFAEALIRTIQIAKSSEISKL